MNIIGEIKETYKSIPNTVKSFLKRALLVFIVWKLIYHLFLFNDRIIDAPLTHLTSFSTSKVLSWIYPNKIFSVFEDCKSLLGRVSAISCIDDVNMDYHKVVGISDYCNGLELYILYIGFLFCLPIMARRLVTFIVIGTVVIYIVNVLRCTTIAMMNINQNKLTDVAHHYIFKMVVYALIFLMWVVYFRKFANKSPDEQ